MKKEAQIVLMKCGVTTNLSGLRMEKIDGAWHFTWAFPISNALAGRENYGATNISGTFYLGDEYNGCPYCGGKNFVKCGRCGKITCWIGEGKYHCQWCGNSGEVSGSISDVNAGSNY